MQTSTTTTYVYERKYKTGVDNLIPIIILGILIVIPLILFISSILKCLMRILCFRPNSKKSKLECDKYIKKYNETNSKNLICEYQECSICLSDVFVYDSNILIINCGHMFHKDCIKEWINTNKSCPICREDVILFNC